MVIVELLLILLLLLLCRSTTDVNVKQSQDEVRPLHLACRYNNDSATYFLLQGDSAVINVKEVKGKPLLHYAARKEPAIINVKDSKGRTPLHYAARKGHEKVIKVRGV